MDSLLEQGSSTAQSVLRTAQLLYPLILLLTLVISSGVHTVLTSKTEEELDAPTVKGPGGKPLPITKRRKREQEASDAHGATGGGGGGFAWSVFLYLTGAIVVSFVANGAAVAVHAMKSSSDAGLDNAWWCGEERIVSFAPPTHRGGLV